MIPAAWPDPAELLPHGATARCIDGIEAFESGKGVRARWRVHAGSALYDPAYSGVPAWCGIEIMAQCAGLYLGLCRNRADNRDPPATGYLLGVRRFHAREAIFPRGLELVIEADCEAVDHTAGELGTFECRILCADNEGARARLLLWRAEDAPGDA